MSQTAPIDPEAFCAFEHAGWVELAARDHDSFSRLTTQAVGRLRWRVESADAVMNAFLEGGVRTRGLLRAQTPAALEAIGAGLREMLRPYRRDGGLELPAPALLLSALKP